MCQVRARDWLSWAEVPECGTGDLHRLSSVAVCALTRSGMQTDGNLPVFFAKKALRAEALGSYLQCLSTICFTERQRRLWPEGHPS